MNVNCGKTNKVAGLRPSVFDCDAAGVDKDAGRGPAIFDCAAHGGKCGGV